MCARVSYTLTHTHSIIHISRQVYNGQTHTHTSIPPNNCMKFYQIKTKTNPFHYLDSILFLLLLLLVSQNVLVKDIFVSAAHRKWCLRIDCWGSRVVFFIVFFFEEEKLTEKGWKGSNFGKLSKINNRQYFTILLTQNKRTRLLFVGICSALDWNTFRRFYFVGFVVAANISSLPQYNQNIRQIRYVSLSIFGYSLMFSSPSKYTSLSSDVSPLFVDSDEDECVYRVLLFVYRHRKSYIDRTLTRPDQTLNSWEWRQFLMYLYNYRYRKI